MGQKDTPVSTKANLAISLLVIAVAVGYFALGTGRSEKRDSGTAAITSSPSSAKAPHTGAAESVAHSTAGAEAQKAIVAPAAVTPDGVGEKQQAAASDRPFTHPVPYEIVPAQPELSAEAASSLAAELNMQVQGSPDDLPEDLKAQLHAAPPELPEDLRKQLNAPPPEIPDDIKAQMLIPSRRVSIDEVNDPNFLNRKAQAEGQTEQAPSE